MIGHVLLLFAKKPATRTSAFTGTGHPATTGRASGIGRNSLAGTGHPSGPSGSQVRATGVVGASFFGTGHPATHTQAASSALFRVPSEAYTQADWAARLAAELPSEWFPAEAFQNGGVVYTILFSLAANYVFHNQQTAFQGQQTRIATAMGSSLDAIAADFFGESLPRILGESDDSYRPRILESITAPKSTIAAIQTAINNYIQEFNPPFISATVFDAMTQPSTCQVLGVGPPDFCIGLTYVVTTNVAWFLDSDPSGYLGSSTFLTSLALTDGPPDAGLDAAIREVKAEGTEPVYAVLNGI